MVKVTGVSRTTGVSNMSFLDNLEDNLKALENRDEKNPEKLKQDRQRIEAERSAAQQRAPYAEALKNSAFTSELLTQCRAIGHGLRVLVRFTWVGETLRLDAKEKRMDLIPTPEGVIAVISARGTELRREKVDFESADPAALACAWLKSEPPASR
jgi:hypothetical protein